MPAYYNEFDPYAAQWLRNLIAAGLIAAGDVDERSITEVGASDLIGYSQCHFFAGIGGWSYALRLAGWPDDKPVWTGSCPCQPLSSAGQRKGHADERHLWPAFYGLIAECAPPVIFGEQVAGKIGLEWLSGIRADLETTRYAVGASDLCCGAVGSPQRRQRLYWVAHREGLEAWGAKPAHGLQNPSAHWSEYVEQTGRCCDHHRRHKRRAPPGVLLVADGISENVAAITPFGNAIVPQLGAAFVQAYIDVRAA